MDPLPKRATESARRIRGSSVLSSKVSRAPFSDCCPGVGPGTERYERIRGALESAEAATRHPSWIARPESAAQVAALVRRARAGGHALTVRGGSHSHLCAQEGVCMVDLSAFRSATWHGDGVIAGGGALMGDLVGACPEGRTLPIGAAHTPGMGLALQGGIGALSRSLGLTLDHLEELTLVAGTGEIVTVSKERNGALARLWHGMRGAGPRFGIVTEARFRPAAVPDSIRFRTVKLDLEKLPLYAALAPQLPREVSAAALTCRHAGAGDPALYLLVAYNSTEASVHQEADDLLAPLFDDHRAIRWQSDGAAPYADQPPYDMPDDDGRFVAAWRPGDPEDRRLRLYKKTLLLRSLPERIAQEVVRLLRNPPTPFCRIDWQHAGGAVADIPPEASAFGCRAFEWNTTVAGGWRWGSPHEAACQAWVRSVRDTLEPVTAGSYAVEIVPGDPDTDRELTAAFGPNLPRLRALAAEWDPASVFRYAPPFG